MFQLQFSDYSVWEDYTATGDGNEGRYEYRVDAQMAKEEAESLWQGTELRITEV